MTHKTSHKVLNSTIDKAKKKIKVGKIYFHWQDPKKHYKILGIGFCEWDETPCVIYQQLEEPKLVWIRRVEGENGWLTKVKMDGKMVDRFTLVR